MKRLYIWYDVDFNQQQLIATSLQDARRELLKQGQFAIRIRASKRIRATIFSLPALLTITKQLATMLKAGLPIVESLTLLATEQHTLEWQYLLNEIKRKLLKGEQLSQVLADYREIFSPLYCEIVAIGELTGQLDESFGQLVIQIERSLQLQKRIKRALRYPIFLLFVSVIVTLVMLLFVLPKFADVYASFDAKLPPFTQLVIDCSLFLQRNGLLLLILAIGSFTVYWRYIKTVYQTKIDSWCSHLPLFGKIIQIGSLTQLFQTLSVTQKAGIPLLSGLNAAANTINNFRYKQAVWQMIEIIKRGDPFSYAVSQYAIFPPLCFQLIRVGEESGSLDLMLEKLASYYREQSEELTDNLSQKFEPLLMLILAFIIGGLIIAMYLPMFQLGDVIH
ncbi:protein transport protein HofC [Orbaceae bacterium ESL0721]|nr:protein transport protein HofC [Orbaceae bacterium ESL0721]